MIHEQIKISVPGYEEKADLYTYFLDRSEETGLDRTRPVILVCPGGGYSMTSDREAEAVAIQFLAAGYHAAILRYSVSPSRYPVALLQLASAVCYLRKHAEEYGIERDKVIVQGFSAGGHLVASLGVFWDRDLIRDTLRIDSISCRPNGLILCYPVITSGEKAHQGSFEALLGEREAELREEMSLEKQVTKKLPPVFLWHTATDDCVPVENSLTFFQAAKDAGVYAEMHIYPVGGHGLSLATAETAKPDGFGIQEECQSWLPLVQKWIRKVCF